jgi:hypothetical protein
MSRENNMKLRAVIGGAGNIAEFELSNYSGGGSFRLRLHELEGSWYWVLEGNGYDRTLLFRWADNGSWDSSDLDEIGMEALNLYRTGNDLEELDARLREQIESRTGVTLPSVLPRADDAAMRRLVGG